MNMKDVKAITIPEGTVKKIEDSNGNIIWGSQAAFPYRILEYIDIPSNAYISTNDNGNSNIGYYIDANWNLNNDTLANGECAFGSIYNNGSNHYRYHLATNANITMQACSGNATYTSLFNASISARHVIELNYHTYNDKKAYVDNVDKGTFSPISGTNTGYLRVGARTVNNGGTVTITNYPHAIRVYSMKQKTSASTNTYFYPVQRKSDGKVGLLKIYNNGAAIRFCTSETSTECIAGPTVQEYFTGTEWPS